MKFKNPTSLK